MIKVLHFVSTPAIWSGVMSVIMNYYRHIDRSRVQFDFLCFLPCEESYEKEINELGGQVFFISKPSASPRMLKELTAFFKKHQGEYQWLHNHEVYLSFLLKPISEHYGIKDFIVHSHATRYSDRKWAAVRNHFFCTLIRFMNCEKLACSHSSGQFLYGETAMKNGNVKILYNAIDCSKYRFDEAKRNALRAQMRIRDNELVLGHIGRFYAQKNHRFLLKIYSAFHKLIPNSKFLCIGDGPLMAEIKEQADQLQLTDCLLFLGQRKDISELLNIMDIFLLPSIFEGSPVSLIEACCNGLPCIISDTIEWEAHSKQVTRFSLHLSPEAWARKALELSQNDRKKVEIPDLFDINRQVKQLETIYEGACGQKMLGCGRM